MFLLLTLMLAVLSLLYMVAIAGFSIDGISSYQNSEGEIAVANDVFIKTLHRKFRNTSEMLPPGSSPMNFANFTRKHLCHSLFFK